MKYEINSDGISLEVSFQSDENTLNISTGSQTLQLEAVEIQSGVYSVLMNNRSFVVGVGDNNGFGVNVNGTPVSIELLDAVHLHLRELGWDSMQESKAGLVSAQIPGLITKIFKQIGESVTEGEPLLLIEAMKMENEIKCPVAGVVLKISVSEGQTVEKGTNIIEIG